MQAKRLMKEADALVDNHEFEKAIEVYKEIIRLEGPQEEGVLSALSETLNYAHLLFISNLVAQYPQEPSPHIQRIVQLYQMQRFQTCLYRCSDFLKGFTLDEKTELRIRSIRFKVSIRLHEDYYILEDFLTMWRAYSNSAKIRSHLMLDLLSISHPQMIAVFTSLSADEMFSEEIRGLFKQKLEHLVSFQKIFGEI